MTNWTEQKIIEEGYKIENAKITSVDISTRDYASAVLQMTIEGAGWGVVYGGKKLAHAGTCLKSEEIEASGKGFESILQIMWTLGVDSFKDLEGKYVRVVTEGWGSSIEIIGDIMKDRWFDYRTFFDDETVMPNPRKEKINEQI